MTISLSDLWYSYGFTLAAAAALFALLSLLIRSFARVGHPVNEPLRWIRNWLFPCVLLLYLMLTHLRVPPSSPLFRIAETIFLCMAIGIAPSLLKSLFFVRHPEEGWTTRVPELFLDLLRVSLVAAGVALVFAGVWGRDLGAFFATLGVGSIVLGLALQDTLGNLMAGIALLFERPFSVGHWIKVGDTIGVVKEMNWRAVHLLPRSLDLVIVPNSVLAKERIQNFSRPTDLHGELVEVGFSYNDPPNKVKRVLTKVAESTRGVLREGLVIRTLAFGDFAVTYQVRFFITDYDRLEEIREEFMTQIWYAVRRNGLSIPFPIRTIYKTEMPLAPVVDSVDEVRKALKAIGILSPLSEEEMDSLARDAIIQEFASGERVVYQEDDGDALYIIRTGRAHVVLTDPSGTDNVIAELRAGDFFGEMALLTGELRTANVDAVEDLEVIVIYKNALEHILTNRPELVEAIASVVVARQSELKQAREKREAESTESHSAAATNRSEMLQKIRRFFSLPG